MDKYTEEHRLCVVGHESEPFCNARYDGWTCTRQVGHSGDHIACGALDHNYKTWPRSRSEQTVLGPEREQTVSPSEQTAPAQERDPSSPAETPTESKSGPSQDPSAERLQMVVVMSQLAARLEDLEERLDNVEGRLLMVEGLE